MKPGWDIFCTVIDNYGDIGICWRVARELTHEHGQEVRLWVDDLESFRMICPELDAGAAVQVQEGVEIRHWTKAMAAVEPADVVVEAFACRVPETFLQAMAARSPKPVWINLEYFSAEKWVAENHGLSSPHPRLPLTQYFFIPGIGPGTGGMLGNRQVIRQLSEFQTNEFEKQAFWQTCGVPDDGALHISLFAYDNPAVPSLIEGLYMAGKKMRLLASEGKSLGQVAKSLNLPKLQAGDTHVRGNLTVQALPFMEQGRYDKLLWACDINFVRGEDSFIRAQHAAKPLVWQAYVQEEGAQWPKIEAFLGNYVAGLSPNAETALREAWRVWNEGESSAQTWLNWLPHLPEYQQHAQRWAGKLQAWPNLVEELVKFALVKV